MKRRLFWKILLGFWLTFFLIIQGIWLMFAVLRPFPEQFVTPQGAQILVDSASAVLRLGGKPAFDSLVKQWPETQRSQIRISPGSRLADGATVKAPDGQSYVISYSPRPRASNRGPLHIPIEILSSAALGGLAFSAILAWYLTQPINRLRSGFGSLAQGNLATRLGPSMGKRRDEIADLARDFDQMAVRLEELVAARDRLLADVSHELRTPLARLNLAIGLARQDPAKTEHSLCRISDEVEKLDEMVSELLTLAKLESNQGAGTEYFSFAEVVNSVVQDARLEAAAYNVALTSVLKSEETLGEWIALGSGKLVSRAVENVLRNAIRFSPEGSQVELMLRSQAGTYILEISDQGPGVSEEASKKLFQPFGNSTDGIGLGLSIAQRAVAVHGGKIYGRNRQSGGFEMTIEIPAMEIE
jgi:two-component system, OmpR family, sensor kinase